MLTPAALLRALVPRRDTSCLYCLDLDEWTPAPGSSSFPDGFRLDFPVARKDLAAIDLQDLDITPQELRKRQELGDQIALVHHLGKAIHRSLVQTKGWGAIDGRRKHLSLGLKDGYVHYCQTAPSCRGKGIYPRVLIAIASMTKVKGLRKLYIACNSENRASICGIQKAGFRLLRTVSVLSVLNGRLSWIQNQNPQAQLKVE